MSKPISVMQRFETLMMDLERDQILVVQVLPKSEFNKLNSPEIVVGVNDEDQLVLFYDTTPPQETK